VKFNKIITKLVRNLQLEKNNCNFFPISLSKNSKISPENKNTDAMAYDSLVEKINKEKKTNSLWALCLAILH